MNKTIKLFGNASGNMKKEIRRELIFDSSVLVDEKLLTDTSTLDKMQLYVLVQFYEELITKHNMSMLQILMSFADKDGMLQISKL